MTAICFFSSLFFLFLQPVEAKKADADDGYGNDTVNPQPILAETLEVVS